MAAKKKTSNTRSIPTNKVQVNFNVEADVLEKARTIAFKEGVNNSELFNMALQKFVELYEQKNGKVHLPKSKGEGLKEL